MERALKSLWQSWDSVPWTWWTLSPSAWQVKMPHNVEPVTTCIELQQIICNDGQYVIMLHPALLRSEEDGMDMRSQENVLLRL